MAAFEGDLEWRDGSGSGGFWSGRRRRVCPASTVSRLKQVWAQEYRSWSDERLDKDRWVYVWADGVYSGLRAEHTKLCALVVVGVNERGEKRFSGD